MSDKTLRRRRRNLTGCVEPCRECGNQIGASHYGNGIGERIKKYRVCFNCDFWFNLLGEHWMYAFAKATGPEVELDWVRNNGRALVIEGCHYVADTYDSVTCGMRGFGGREGRFIMLGDRGETVHSSTNMWYQGEVPERFRERMPDTAYWVDDAHRLTPIKMGV